MKRFIALVVSLLCLGLAGVIIAGTAEMKETQYMGSKEFEHMKNLAGAWEGTTGMSKEEQKVRVEYRLTGAGSAIVETILPNTAHEMVTVYYDDDGKLTMTHYCALRNQPRMAIKSAGEKELVFDFIGGSNIDPKKDAHMHALTIIFEDNNHIAEKWTLFEEGSEKGATTFTLTRVKEK
jgi:hypothetical protein